MRIWVGFYNGLETPYVSQHPGVVWSRIASDYLGRRDTSEDTKARLVREGWKVVAFKEIGDE